MENFGKICRHLVALAIYGALIGVGAFLCVGVFVVVVPLL